MRTFLTLRSASVHLDVYSYWATHDVGLTLRAFALEDRNSSDTIKRTAFASAAEMQIARQQRSVEVKRDGQECLAVAYRV